MSIAALTQMPFSEACEGWLESRRPYLAAKTQYEYALNLRTLSNFFGALRLPEIDGDLIRAYQRSRQQDGLGASAINHEVNLICQMRKRVAMPLTDYQPLKLPQEECGRALTEEERTRLLRVAFSRHHWEAAALAIGISLNSTAGPKEMRTLRLKDVDLARKEFYVQPGGCKNIHRPRKIPLNDESLRYMEQAMARAASLGAVEPEHYLFPFRVYGGQNPKHDPSRPQTTFKTAWKRVRLESKVLNFRMYDCRHHAITALLENPEVSEQTVEDIAGHVSRRMKKRYSHIRMEYKRTAIDAISRAKAEPRPIKKPAKCTAKGNRADVVAQLAEVLGKLLNSA